MSLYRGELYAMESARALIEGERLRAYYLGLLHNLLGHHYRHRQYRQAMRYIFRLLEYDPCHDVAHRLAMHCYLKMGWRSRALRHYRVCCQVLEVEYGSQPEAETAALFEQIRLDPGRIMADERGVLDTLRPL